MNKTFLQLQPYMRNAADHKFDSLGARVAIKSGAEQTGGAFNLFDVWLPAGYETPLHIHYAEDVAIQVQRGTLDIFWGTERQQAKAGSFFFQPRSLSHGFRVTGTFPARISYLTVPAGFDRFVIERSRPVTDVEARILEAQFKIEVLGTLPK